MRKNINIFGFLFFAVLTLHADDRGVEVRPNGTELIETEPRKTVTTVFRITSKSASPRTFISEAGLPEGWKPITQDFPFELAPNQSETRILSFFVPQSAAAGIYEILYQVKDREFPSQLDSYTLRVHVLPYRKLVMRVLETPRSVIAGESYKIALMINNESNVSDTVRFSATSLEKYTALITPSALPLGKGQSATVLVTVQTDPKIIKITKDNVQIFARFSIDREWVASQTTSVDVIPRITGTGDRYHRIPVQAVLSEVIETAGSKTKSGFQGEISGAGSLSESGNRNIQFLFRGPDIYQTSIYAQHDEYSIAYASKNLDVSIGDRAYSLTTLTEQNQYGRGIDLQVKLKDMSTGVYFQKTRWYVPQEASAAGYFRRRINNRGEIGLSTMSKEINHETERFVSLTGKYAATKNDEFELEASFSGKGGNIQNGLFVKAAGQHQNVYYYVNGIYTDPGFKGFYQDTRFITGGLSFNIKDHFRVNAAYRYEKQKYMFDTMLYVAPLSQYAQFGLYYRLADGTALMIDAIQQSREDRYPLPRFNYTDRYVKLGVSRSFSTISLDGSIDIGKADDRLNGKTATSRRLTAGVQFRPTNDQTYRGYVNYDDNERYGGERANRLTVGFNANWNIRNKTRLDVNYQNNHSPENYYFDRDMFEIKLSQRLFEKDVFSIRARHTLMRNSFNRTETAVLADYRLNWGLPIAKKKSTAMVTGCLTDGETGLPIRDVVIRINGSSAVTASDGRYIFPSLKPGTYYLRLDKSKIGLNRTTVMPTPIEMSIAGGEQYIVDLAVTRSASVTGKVVLCKLAADTAIGSSKNVIREDGQFIMIQKAAQIENGRKDGIIRVDSANGGRNGYIDCNGLSNILVEMTKGNEVLRRMTDAEGRFNFEEVRPGTWTLKLYKYNLPEYHRFEKESYTVELKPGSAHSQEIHVVPQKRKIRMIEEGGTVREEKN